MVETAEDTAPGKAFWSGTITFGLVSIPVDLYSAHRPRSARLRMVDQSGVLLHRRYVCPGDHQPVAGDAIVRGYEIEEGRYIEIADQELESLEPKKSREIDLRSFVDVAEVDPIYFQHAYFLLPAGLVTKAYRLLAYVMERGQRAGIATFVMREREHLVAILAQGGILRAETLRFSDELRSPQGIGLPPRREVAGKVVDRLRGEIDRLRQPGFDRERLHDRHAERLHDLVRQKLAAGAEVREMPAEAAAAGAEIIDLMEIIKRRFNSSPSLDGALLSPR